MQLQHPPRNTPGSFVKPETLVQHMEAAKKQSLPPPEDAQILEETKKPAKSDEVVAPGQKDPKAEEAEQKYQDFLKFKKQSEESLGIEITDEDIRNLIFKGRMRKALTIIPGYLTGVFQTLLGTEIEVIDQHMAAWRDRTTKDSSGKEVPVSFTQQGLEDEKAKTLLSYVWLNSYEILPDGQSRDRPLGSKVEDRRKTIEAMGAHIISEAGRAWSEYEIFVRIMLREKTYLKKS